MGSDQIQRLIEDFHGKRCSRREILARGTALGLSLPALVALLTASSPRRALAQDASNPLGVDPEAPLDVVIFKGGYGDDYAIYVNDNMYKKLYPNAEITYAGIQRLGEQLQPRFVAGEPPDVIDNSGAGNLDNTALVAEGQLADLADLMAAPSYDTEGATFAETLVPGTQDDGVFDGTQYLLNWALSAYGVWYSSSLFEQNGWTYPTTWDEHLALCEEIKGSGMAPWLTTGVHPQYALEFVFNEMLWKHDPQAIINIDNLEADAWKAPAVADVLEAMYTLAERDYIGEGWEGLDHVQSQNEWLQGKAAFLPCGTWLENEMKDSIPEGFDMVIAPTPSLPGDVIPFEGILAGAGEKFIVPSQGKNVQGGKEWVRLLFSKEGGRTFAELTKSLSTVQGSGEGLDLGTAFASTQAAITAAGQNTFTARYPGWYRDFREAAKLELAALLQLESSVEDCQNAIQELADELKDDDSIPKFSR
jgi:N-acetylglucosamine transport system substrate-binding protein